MTRGGYRPGSGQPPVAGQPQTERINLTLTEAERAEIEAAVPEGRPVGRWIVDAAVMRARSGTAMMKPGERFKIGSRVCTLEGAEVEIVRHGRDTSGVYTEIKFADGSKERVHRSFLRAMRARSGR